MGELVVDRAAVCFTPSPEWQWVGWDGCLSLRVQDDRVQVQGQGVALTVDLTNLATELVGKTYTATGFDATPGQIGTPQVVVNPAALSMRMSIDGQPVVLSSTIGTFICSVVTPSMSGSTPPVPDPVKPKSGTWAIEEPGQDRFTET